jgi:hypothetical protein
LIGVLILSSLVSCGPRVALTPGDAGTILPAQAPTTRQAIVAQSTGHPGGPVVPISPTQVTAENNTLGGTPMQPPFGDESSESVKFAKQDLAQRLGVSVDDVTVAAVIGQEFSTDAFYCRTIKERIAKDEPPAVITGFIILLHVSGRRYEYHASGATVLFCRPLP